MLNADGTYSYPWAHGETLTAAALNAAIAQASESSTAGVSRVTDFGATGNGTTDDTAAIQAAVAALPSTGGALYFPTGRYLIHASILLPSNSTARGDGPGSVLLASATWPMNGNFPTGNYSLISNQNYAQGFNTSTLIDHDILVEDLQFDYGGLSGVSTPDGSTHAARFCYVTNVTVRNCTFQVRGQANATAMVGCYNSLVESCTAYGFTNCGWDHWNGPQKACVVSCYAETASSAQMVNFNPDGGSWVGDGFRLANCSFTVTGAAGIPIQLEPLQAGGAVSNIVVEGNVFRNTTIVCRGATTGVVITGNVFICGSGVTGEVIASYALYGGTPDNFVVADNAIIGATTASGSLGVIRCQGNHGAVVGNYISGTAYGSWAIYAPNFHVSGNSTQKDTLSNTCGGWTAMTGTSDIGSTFNTASVTLPQLAGRVMAIQAALHTLGIVGP